MAALTYIANRPDDWRETMPVWAHMVWAMWRRNNPFYLKYELVSFFPEDPDFGDGGWVIIRLVNPHVPSEYRTTERYVSRAWL